MTIRETGQDVQQLSESTSVSRGVLKTLRRDKAGQLANNAEESLVQSLWPTFTGGGVLPETDTCLTGLLL